MPAETRRMRALYIPLVASWALVLWLAPGAGADRAPAQALRSGQPVMRSTALTARALTVTARRARAGGARASCRRIRGPSSSAPRRPARRSQRGLRCQARARVAHGRAGHGTHPQRTLRHLPATLVAARARASTIATVLATPCQNTELNPAPGNLGLVRAAVLCLINRERADHGEMPLKLNGALQRAAESHSAEMVAADYFEHVSPGGLTPVDRVSSAGYIPNPMVGYVIGENIAWGTLSLSTPEAIVGAWIASPPHLANILFGEYRDTGIGVSAETPVALSGGETGATYTQDFGVIIA
jgi:uncharacterized protein YkwD